MRAGDHWLGPSPLDETVSVTILLKPPAGLAEKLLSGQYHPPSREAAEQEMAASAQVLAAIRQFAEQHGLTIRSEDPSSRRVVLEGTVQQMNKAFDVEIGEFKDAAGHTFPSFRGTIQLPPELRDDITAVLGLDRRPVARHTGA